MNVTGGVIAPPNAVAQFSGVAPVDAWLTSTSSTLAVSVIPGMPVSEAPPRLAETAVQRRVSVVAVGERIATVSEPLESEKPMPPTPRNRFETVRPIVVSVPLASAGPEPTFTLVTSCFVSEKPTVPETRPNRSMVALPVICSGVEAAKSIGCVPPFASVTTSASP